MTKQETITLSISEDDKIFLQRRADEFGYSSRSALIKGICNGEILLLKSGKPTKVEKKFILVAIARIQDALDIIQKALDTLRERIT